MKIFRRRVLALLLAAGALHAAQEDDCAAPEAALRLSTDSGRYVVEAHDAALSIYETGVGLVRRLEGRSLDGRLQGPATALFAMPQRRSIVAAWPALGEVWELSLDPQAPPVYDGLVHDYRMGEAIARRGFLYPSRARIGPPFPDLRFADPRVPWLAGVVPEGVAIVHLDVRRQIAPLPCREPRLERAELRGEGGAMRWWLPCGDRLLVVDPVRWRVVEEREALRPDTPPGAADRGCGCRACPPR
ncbi:MAG: hypothetical protein KF892_06920 [Rhizobacter sp.]|nr:hypothetical protein [Rhizobacter sp.]